MLTEETFPAAYSRQKCFCMIILLLVFTFWITVHFCSINDSFSHDIKVYTGFKGSENYVIQQPGCHIPGMFTFGPLVDDYLQKVSSLSCEIRETRHGHRKNVADISENQAPQKSWQPAVIYEQNGTLNFDETALKFYGKANMNCTYQNFRRKKFDRRANDRNYSDDEIEYFGSRRQLPTDEVAKISENDEFIRVTCQKNEIDDENKFEGKKITNKQSYTDFFAFVPLKKDVEKRCEDHAIATDHVNVLVIGLDALSRLNFHRQMVSSASYLKYDMGAIEMMGYNKVGDNTFPNLIPMLTGLSVEELKKRCWPSESEVFDKCPLIWNTFRKFGYRTNFAEDSANIGVFNYLKRGFHDQPTDYYLRPFNIEAELRIGHTKPGNCFLCLGARLNLSVLLEYARKYARAFSAKRYFGFFWSSSFTHDFFNLPPQGDVAVLEFLQRLRRDDRGLLNNTVLLMVSDHGLRWGSFRETFQGHLEERLPMLWFVFPSWFENAYREAMKNLRRNALTLTTPFDLYETFHDFMNLTRLKDTEIERRAARRKSKLRRTSLFLPVSSGRTCSDAAVPKHYCTCHNKVGQLRTDDELVVKAANALVSAINQLLTNHTQCAELTLESVERASVERSVSAIGGKLVDEFSETSDRGRNGTLSSSSGSRPNSVSNYVIMGKTTPGHGVFEATVRYDSSTEKFLVIGSISRVNTYGSQSICIQSYILRLYCYCKEQE